MAQFAGRRGYNAASYRVSFFYDLSKGFVSRIAFALAHELRDAQATSVLLTPGWLRSEVMLELHGVSDPKVRRSHGQSLSSGQLAREYGFTDLDGSQPDAWRYIVEVQDAGKPTDTTGYR